MEEKNNSEAQKLVERIIIDNDTSRLDKLTSNMDEEKKRNILASIKKLDMKPLSTPVACGG